MSIKHAFTNPKTDGADATITRPSDWNADHVIQAGTITYAQIQNVSATDKLLGRVTAAAGVIEEIVCTAAGRALIDDANAAAQLTTLGAAAASHTHPASDITSGLAAVATSGSATDLAAGTLPAGRMPALTGDVTTTVNTVATTIANNAVSLAKMAQVATASVLGRNTAATGNVEVLTTLPTGVIPAFTGDVTTPGGSLATTIAAGAVSLAKMANIATATLIGRTTAGTGVPEALTVLPTACMPALSGDIGNTAGSLVTAIGANKVTLAMLAQVATATFRGRVTAATGNMEDMTATQATSLLNVRTETLKGLMPANMGVRASLATNKSIANTLTQVVGFTAAANTLAVGTVIRFRGIGLLTNTTSASTSVLTLRINSASLGATLEASISFVMGIVARTNCPFDVQGEIVVVSTGAGGTAFGCLTVNCATATALGVSTTMVTAVVTAITTQSNVVELTCISGATTTTWNFISATAEVVQP